MPLGSGDRLGSYQVIAPLGAGGMGEVYRARDTRLGRDVALKILPQTFASDPDRLARFDREAQLLAAISHPNIAAIYGIEESTGVRALVLELVDGPTLADRIARGPLPVEDALAIARQVCDALAAAHDHGIIHRDLKPANVKLRADGVVKVLDFGLAKLAEGPSTSAAETRLGLDAAARTTGVISGVGIILGTAAYMSPEQAKGQEADKRADVWALGCLLYEMLTAKRPFEGGTTTEVLAAVLHTDPEWGALPPRTPAVVKRLLRRCLQKDPRKRLHDVTDARLDIDDALSAPEPVMQTPASGPSRPALWLAATAAVALVAGLGGWWFSRSAVRPPATSLHAMIALPPATTIGFSRGSAVVLSADGRQVAFTGTNGSATRLYVRPIDRIGATPIDNTEGAANPFFSPDGQWIGFFADGKLKKVRAAGGGLTVLADAPNPRGEAWGPDDAIYFTPKNNAVVWRVPAAGGTPQEVTRLAKGEFSHRWPQILPGGKAILFTVWNDTGFEGGRVAVQRLDSPEHTILIPGAGYPRYVGPDADGRGYLLYAQADGMMAVPFDLDRLQATGTPARALDNVMTNLSGGAHLSAAAGGLLAYLPGTLSEIDRELAWFDRSGKAQTVASIHGMSLTYALSNDGRRVARQSVVGAHRDMWIEELDRGTSTRFTVDEYTFAARWTADGQWIAYTANQPVLNLYRKRADGTGSEERLTSSPNNQAPSSWTPDGRTLVFVDNDPVTGSDIWTLDVDGDRKPKPFLRTPFVESYATVSPDGKWVAYQSNESGRFEIYVTPFPEGGRKYQVSTDGGFSPAWAHSGRELFYQTNRGMMAASIVTQPAFAAGRPQLLFEGRFNGDTNVAPDDSRFLLLKGLPQETSATQISIVTNWLDELKKLLPGAP